MSYHCWWTVNRIIQHDWDVLIVLIFYFFNKQIMKASLFVGDDEDDGDQYQQEVSDLQMSSLQSLERRYGERLSTSAQFLYCI